jgi:hypothetical protein
MAGDVMLELPLSAHYDHTIAATSTLCSRGDTMAGELTDKGS